MIGSSLKNLGDRIFLIRGKEAPGECVPGMPEFFKYLV
jgi:hypothetical protein